MSFFRRYHWAQLVVGAAVLVVAASLVCAMPLPLDVPIIDALKGDALTGRVVGQFDGLPKAGITVKFGTASTVTDATGEFTVCCATSNQLQRLTFTGPGILPRSTYAHLGDSKWKVVPAGFDTAAFHDLARSYSSGTIRWAQKPRIYIDTRPHGNVPAASLALWADEVVVQAPLFVTSWSAGTIRPVAVKTNSPPADLASGTIVIKFSTLSADFGGGPYIGYARVVWNGSNGITAATVALRYKQYSSNPTKRQGILAHELGHALGYRHMFESVSSLMQPSLGSKTDLLAYDRLAARFMYGREPGNLATDVDSKYDGSLALAHGGYWEGE